MTSSNVVSILIDLQHSSYQDRFKKMEMIEDISDLSKKFSFCNVQESNDSFPVGIQIENTTEPIWRISLPWGLTPACLLIIKNILLDLNNVAKSENHPIATDNIPKFNKTIEFPDCMYQKTNKEHLNLIYDVIKNLNNLWAEEYPHGDLINDELTVFIRNGNDRFMIFSPVIPIILELIHNILIHTSTTNRIDNFNNFLTEGGWSCPS